MSTTQVEFEWLEGDYVWNNDYFFALWNDYIGSRYFTINNHKLKILNKYTQLEVSCLKCKHSFTVPVEKFLLWKKCIICYPIPPLSLGELTVMKFLHSKHIDFEMQKTFSSCKRIKALRFDFFIPKYRLLIEVNGVHHYKPHSYGSDKSEETKNANLALVQERDTIKRQWAKSNGYTLWELNYSQLKIFDKLFNDFINENF